MPTPRSWTIDWVTPPPSTERRMAGIPRGLCSGRTGELRLFAAIMRTRSRFGRPTSISRDDGHTQRGRLPQSARIQPFTGRISPSVSRQLCGAGMNRPLLVKHLSRRQMLQVLSAAGTLGLGACTSSSWLGTAEPESLAPGDRARFLAPLRARTDRIFDITVCLRPFRAAGPRLDTERIRDTLVVHNYGHGGSGWSLSWGSSTIAVNKALTASPDRIGVVGCGVLGLTSALIAQAAGKPVTIYARDLIQQSMSARATGSFTPDSRIALADAISPEFPALWEEMARTSHKTFRSHLGLPGDPVRWVDRYIVADSASPPAHAPAEGELKFAAFGNRLGDLFPHAENLRPADTPFRAAIVRRRSLP